MRRKELRSQALSILPTWSEEAQRSGLVPRTRTLRDVRGIKLFCAVQGDRNLVRLEAW